jgi:hypothetical protein
LNYSGFKSLGALTWQLVALLGAQTLAVSDKPAAAYTKLVFARPIIEAEAIVVAEAKWVNSDDDYVLLSLGSVSEVFTETTLTGAEAGWFILSSKRVTADTPIIAPGRRHLLFLREVQNPDLVKRFSLAQSAILYEPCKGWESAVILDFSIKSLASKLLKEKYGINDERDFLVAVDEFCRWRNLKSRNEQLSHLLNLLNKWKQSLFFVENIVPLIRTLGGQAIEVDGRYMLSETSSEIQ